MKYKVTNITKSGSGMGVAELTVTLDDGSTYNKRMMVELTSEETVHADIQQWLADYLQVKAEELTFNPAGMSGLTTVIEPGDLPKTSKDQVREEEARKAAELMNSKSETP